MQPDNQHIHTLIENLFMAWNRHNQDEVATFFAPSCHIEDISQPTTQQGTQSAQEWIHAYLTAVPDLHFACEQIIAESDRASAVWTVTGTHKGTFIRIPPTQKSLSVRGVSIFTIESGQVTYLLNIWDMAGLLRDIGLLPSL